MFKFLLCHHVIHFHFYFSCLIESSDWMAAASLHGVNRFFEHLIWEPPAYFLRKVLWWIYVGCPSYDHAWLVKGVLTALLFSVDWTEELFLEKIIVLVLFSERVNAFCFSFLLFKALVELDLIWLTVKPVSVGRQGLQVWNVFKRAFVEGNLYGAVSPLLFVGSSSPSFGTFLALPSVMKPFTYHWGVCVLCFVLLSQLERVLSLPAELSFELYDLILYVGKARVHFFINWEILFRYDPCFVEHLLPFEARL